MRNSRRPIPRGTRIETLRTFPKDTTPVLYGVPRRLVGVSGVGTVPEDPTLTRPLTQPVGPTVTFLRGGSILCVRRARTGRHEGHSGPLVAVRRDTYSTVLLLSWQTGITNPSSRPGRGVGCVRVLLPAGVVGADSTGGRDSLPP